MESEGKQPGFMTAIWQFEREMDALMHPVTREELMEATKRLLIGMFEFSAKQSATRTNIFAERNEIPTAYELEHDTESLPEMLKLGLYEGLAEEYIILFGKKEFDKWIGPFIRSVLRGHIEESASLEHMNECPDEKDTTLGSRFCPAVIMKRMFSDRLMENRAGIEKNERYLVFPSEIVHMNVSIVRELRDVGVFSDSEAEDLLDDYWWWLESIDDGAVNFDRKIFKR